MGWSEVHKICVKWVKMGWSLVHKISSVCVCGGWGVGVGGVRTCVVCVCVHACVFVCDLPRSTVWHQEGKKAEKINP